MTTLAPDSATQLTSGSTVMVEALLLARAKPSSMATALRQTMSAVMDPKGTRVAVLPGLTRPSMAAWAYRGGASSARAGSGTRRRASTTSQCTSIHARGPDGITLAIPRAGVQHVELGDGQGIAPVDPRRVAQADGVHPSAASRPARDRAELLAARAQQVGNVAAQLRGERAVPHPRAIGLGDADRPVDLGRGHARSRAGSARGRARRRDEGVGAVVEVQRGPLGALEEHGGACLHPAVEEKGGVGDIGRQPSGIAEIRAQDALDGEALRVVDLAEEPVLLRHVVFELLAEQALVEEIGHANAHAGGPVGI